MPLLSLTLAKNNMSLNRFLMSLTIRFVGFGSPIDCADVNTKSKNGNTALLDKAIRKDDTEIADLIRKHGGKTGEELKAEGK